MKLCLTLHVLGGFASTDRHGGLFHPLPTRFGSTVAIKTPWLTAVKSLCFRSGVWCVILNGMLFYDQLTCIPRANCRFIPLVPNSFQTQLEFFSNGWGCAVYSLQSWGCLLPLTLFRAFNVSHLLALLADDRTGDA